MSIELTKNENTTDDSESLMPQTKSIQFETACIGLALLVGIVAWSLGIYFADMDHDEIEHAHTIWMIQQGEVPFHDFFELHPPLLWYLILPFMRILPESTSALLGLRILTSFASIFLFGLLFSLIKRIRAEL